VLDCAVRLHDPLLIQLASEAVAVQPSLLRTADLSEESPRAVWAAALEKNAEAWRGPSDPMGSLYGVFDDLLGGKVVNAELLRRLSVTPLADIASYDRRTDIWQHLRHETRQNMIAVTASGWLDQMRVGEMSGRPETELAIAIAANRACDDVLVSFIPSKLSVAIRLFSDISELSEARFAAWFSRASGVVRFVPDEAEAIGRLILSRRWQGTANETFVNYQRGRIDLKPALRICYEMFDFWTRFSSDLSPVSQAEKWEALENLAVDLYPEGPDQEAIWDRAGGKNSDLWQKGSGRVRWHEALRQMRNGRGPRPSKLLNEMRKGYPQNDKLRYLADDPTFARW
jgi:hypothetical protein